MQLYMKLYQLRRNSRFRINGIELIFEKVDGMYSICRDDDGNVIHIAANSDVELISAPQP